MHHERKTLYIMTLTKKQYIIGLSVIIALFVALLAYCLFAPLNKGKETSYLYIDNDDNIDSLSSKLSKDCNDLGSATLTILTRHFGYKDNIRTGRYAITPTTGSLQLYRHLRNGQQEPVKLTIPSVRTTERLAEELSEKLMMSKEQLLAYLDSNDSCALYGADTASVIAMFIPNTYEVYWNTSVPKFLSKMHSEQEAFWKGKRQKQAAALGMTPLEVMTMASIVDEETANNAEKPMVAGMYYNRLRKGMPLQADPTIKFALKQFDIRRIYNNMLRVKSPYNTYVNTGLPPGPIRIPSVAGIDAVLNLVKHDYLYMCAKEDFSGTHNFARTYPEHLANAAKYTKALNDRGIK